jgi:microcystin-dependent protein
MAGTIPLSLTQQFDEFGKPLSGGLLWIIQAGTVATPQQPYQDSGLSIVMPNPIPLDAAGRVPQFFLADGQIKVRLTDKNGVVQLARDGILVIGPSISGGGGGGGSSVDPTTILQTGMLALFYGIGSVPGFVRANGRSIGNSSSGATERANSDALALFLFLFAADPNLTLRNSSGGAIPRTGSDAVAATAWANARQLDLPDWRGRAIAGLDDMGNAAAGRLTASYWGGSGIVLGQSGGLESNLLDVTKIPAHQHDAFVFDPGHFHTIQQNSLGVGTGTSPNYFYSFQAPTPTDTKTTGVRVRSTAGGAADDKTGLIGGGLPHANVQPTMLTTIYLKM